MLSVCERDQSWQILESGLRNHQNNPFSFKKAKEALAPPPGQSMLNFLANECVHVLSVLSARGQLLRKGHVLMVAELGMKTRAEN